MNHVTDKIFRLIRSLPPKKRGVSRFHNAFFGTSKKAKSSHLIWLSVLISCTFLVNRTVLSILHWSIILSATLSGLGCSHALHSVNKTVLSIVHKTLILSTDKTPLACKIFFILFCLYGPLLVVFCRVLLGLLKPLL